MNIPIFMLHHVGEPDGKGLKDWSISTSKFDLLLTLIEQKGFSTTTFEEIARNNTSKLAKKVIISFDDCPALLFEHAIPELIRRSMKAVFSIPTAHIGGFNQWDMAEQGFERVTLMSAEQLQYLSQQGMEIASHGQHHLRGDKITEEAFFEEINTSKQLLDRLLNKQTHTLAYPYGEVPQNYKKLLKAAGYQYGLSIYQPNQNILTLRRIGIHQSDSSRSIAFKLSKRYRLLRPLLDIYLSLRTRLLR